MAEPSGAAVGEYELLDAGDGRRLERFGAMVVDRPAPAAEDRPRDAAAWPGADLRFDPRAGWAAAAGRTLGPWAIRVGTLVMELRPTAAGGVGLYPDHLGSIPWLADRVEDRVRPGEAPAAGVDPGPPTVLNLFASTGLATLAMAAAGAAVAHVDASRPTVAWARANAAASGLTGRPIRWLVDDALAFVRREARRGRRYDGIVLDPPSYGHGPSGPGRRIVDALDELLAALVPILRDDAFVLLTSHTPGLDPDVLGRRLAALVGPGAPIEVGPLELRARSGVRLAAGAHARADQR